MNDVTYSDLRSKVILVTGGNSGIGLACVEALLSQGCAIAVGDLHRNALDELASTLPESERHRLTVSRVDVSSQESVDDWVRQTRATFGSVDGVVASAGIEPIADREVHLLPEDIWSRTLGAVATIIEDENPASIVIIGSPTGYFGGELGHHAYSASKGGLVGLGRVMANEYIQREIRVNIVWPGLIDTPMNEFITSDAAVFEREMSQIPRRRPGRPAEIAAMVRFLLSDQASYCVGGIFTVDGGLTAV